MYSPYLPLREQLAVRQDELFATAWHVIEKTPPFLLTRVPRSDRDVVLLEFVDLVFHDEESDFALLRAEPRVRDRENFTFPAPLTVGGRALDEGEPVYAYGYPLPVSKPPLEFTARQLKGMGCPEDELEKLVLPARAPRPIPDDRVLNVVNVRLSPRTTSAIVASNIEFHDTFDPQWLNERRDRYVIDKALNKGNSGGPIIAAETGPVHAFCSHVQSAKTEQPKNMPTIEIPSLYGVVRRGRPARASGSRLGTRRRPFSDVVAV